MQLKQLKVCIILFIFVRLDKLSSWEKWLTWPCGQIWLQRLLSGEDECKEMKKYLTWSHANHFGNILVNCNFLFVTYLLPIHVCFSAMVGHHNSCQAVFLPCPWTLAYNLDLWTRPRQGKGRITCQISMLMVIWFKSYWLDTYKHIFQTQSSIWTTKVINIKE